VAHKITINRAPVLALWATVVAERLGYEPGEALTLGRAVTGLTAQSKGRHLGIYKPRAKEAAEKAAGRKLEAVELLGRFVPAVQTPDGLRAIEKGRPASPESAERYLESKFGADLAAARSAMRKLAEHLAPEALATRAFVLYEKFRPAIPQGVRGWGAKGELDLGRIEALAAGQDDG
jgi:hypothetical protein